MPKKGAKGATPVDDEATIKRKMKAVKEVMEKWLSDGGLQADNAIVNKIYDSQGWMVNEMSKKIVFAGENREGSSASDKVSSVAVKQFGKALKEMCPFYCNVKALCFWRLPIEDDGVKGIVEFAAKPPKPDVWEGLVNLELIECKLSSVSCDLLGEQLANNIALKSLILDFNPLGDEGVSLLAAGLRKNSKLATLKLAYCGITSASAQSLADGMIKGSKIKVLDLKGNRLGIHAASAGQSLQGHALIPMFAALENEVVETLESIQVKAKVREREERQRKMSDPDESRTEPTSKPAGAPARVFDGDELDKLLRVTYSATDKIEGLAPGLWQATSGPWSGWELFITETPASEGGGEGVGRRLMALTETLQKIDLTDNFIQEDVSVASGAARVGGIAAPPQPRIPVGHESLQLTVAVPLNQEDILLPLAELAIEVGVLQGVAGHFRVLHGVAVCCSVLRCVAVCCSVLQCVAVCCSVLQCVAVCCSV